MQNENGEDGKDPYSSGDWMLIYTYFRKTGRKEREREEELPYVSKLLVLGPSVPGERQNKEFLAITSGLLSGQQRQEVKNAP